MIKKFAISLAAALCLNASAATKAPAKVKVACIGNSVTAGYMLANPERECYPTRLAQLLGEGYEVGNFGRSSATLTRHGYMPYWDQPQFRAAMEFTPDVAIIHLGLNDTDPRVWPDREDEFVGDYMALIDSLRIHNPKVRILAAKLSPIAPGHKRYKSSTRAWRHAVNCCIEAAAAAKGVELIDFGAPLAQRLDLLPDNLHPNAEGALILAQTVAGAITGNHGGLSMPTIYQDGMVLQRRQPLRISGTANSGTKVTLRLGSGRAEAIADIAGNWTAILPPQEAAQGQILEVKTPTQTLRFTDVSIGEVWLASGQSNMEFQLSQCTTFASDTLHATDSQLRLYNMRPIAHTDKRPWDSTAMAATDRLEHFLPTRWQQSTPKSAASFSAIAWHFGRILRDSLQVPVGIICNAIGGSGCEAWTNVAQLEEAFPDMLLQWRNGDWLQAWVRGRVAENVGDAGHRHPYEPSYLFSAGILPLGAYPIEGVIWYQGESNANNIELHEALFPLMVEGWRRQWHNPQMPFLTVQLSSLNRLSWPAFRDSQRRLALQIPGVEMAVSSDCGDPSDVHPRTKKPIGQRLAALALNRVYDLPVVAEGPVYKSMEVKGRKLIITYDNAQGLTGTEGFELSEHEGVYVPATARILPDGRVELSAQEITAPRTFRYAWQPFSQGTLRNSFAPASTHKPSN